MVSNSQEKEFMGSPQDYDDMMEACSEGQMDVIDSLLKEIDINTRSFDGELALHRACEQTEPWAIDVVTKLLAHGADVDLENILGCNGLDYALNAVPFQPHIAQLLLDCSKKGINFISRKDYSYLWTAKSVDAFKFLVENGINLNHVRENETYLDIATNPEYVGEPRVDEINYLRSVGAKLYSEL